MTRGYVLIGHVVYEMAAGKDFNAVIPSEVDYSYVKDEGCREVLQYIFTLDDNGDIFHTIHQVRILIKLVL